MEWFHLSRKIDVIHTLPPTSMPLSIKKNKYKAHQPAPCLSKSDQNRYKNSVDGSVIEINPSLSNKFRL